MGMLQAHVQLQLKQQEVHAEVQAAWKVLRQLEQQYASVDSDFETELDQLSEGLVSNYTKSNISLLEFTDMFESYNDSIIQFNKLKADLNNAYEELNYAVGEDIR
jgi:cobalt-zinc-cadmium efflux system outer membrane protein